MVLDLGETKRHQGMHCPHCHVALSMSSREGIEIDYCPQCRGVWLDRGELDKIIERSIGEPAQAAPAPRQSSSRDYDRDDRDRDNDRRKPYKKRKSWIAEIFDELT